MLKLILGFIIELCSSIYGIFTKNKTDTAEQLGEAKVREMDLQQELEKAVAEQKAAANSPTTMEQLIAEQQAGKAP